MFGLRSLASLTSSKPYYIPSLRDISPQHEGKKELVVRAAGTRYTVDFGALAHQMTDQLHQNVRSNLVSSSDHLSCLIRYTIGGR